MENEVIEIWKPVLGWEGVYSVSNLGRVRRNGYGTIGFQSADGYPTVMLSERRPVHQLVVEAFGERLPAVDEDIHHRDEDKTNNRVENLEIVTRTEHKARHQGARYIRLTPEIVAAIRAEPRNGRGRPTKGKQGRGKALKEMAEKYGVSVGAIVAVRSGRSYG